MAEELSIHEVIDKQWTYRSLAPDDLYFSPSKAKKSLWPKWEKTCARLCEKYPCKKCKIPSRASLCIGEHANGTKLMLFGCEKCFNNVEMLAVIPSLPFIVQFEGCTTIFRSKLSKAKTLDELKDLGNKIFIPSALDEDGSLKGEYIVREEISFFGQ
jgi:hypothetical protein